MKANIEYIRREVIDFLSVIDGELEVFVMLIESQDLLLRESVVSSEQSSGQHFTTSVIGFSFEVDLDWIQIGVFDTKMFYFES